MRTRVHIREHSIKQQQLPRAVRVLSRCPTPSQGPYSPASYKYATTLPAKQALQALQHMHQRSSLACQAASLPRPGPGRSGAAHLGRHAQLGAVLAWEGVGGQQLALAKEAHPLLSRVAQQVGAAHHLCMGGREGEKQSGGEGMVRGGGLRELIAGKVGSSARLVGTSSPTLDTCKRQTQPHGRYIDKKY